MYTSAELALFAQAVQRPEDRLDLGQAALLLGAIEDPDLDISGYLERIEALGRRARIRCANREIPALHLARFLFLEEGFMGNLAAYYDPKNSFLHEVLTRRVGIPISLSVLMIEVGRRAGIPIEGVGFPGHFLTRSPAKDGFYFFDPFIGGRILSHADLCQLFTRTTGQKKEPPPEVLQKAGKRQILSRMLRNLRHIYQQQKDTVRLREVLERAALLQPEDASIHKELAALHRASQEARNRN